MRSAYVIWSAIGLGCIAGACMRREPARFPHRAHVASGECRDNCLNCNSCHSHAAEGQSQAAHDLSALPQVSLCETCHTNQRARLSAIVASGQQDQPSGIRFDHDKHLAMPGISGQCVGCHAGVVEPGRASLPPMSQCFSCHEHQQQWDRAQCTPCHVDRDLRTLLPRTFLRHDQAFARRHGMAANQNQALCRTCHAEADCEACHDSSQQLSIERRMPEKIERRFVHTGDFMTVHAMEAKSQPSRCLRCHEPKTCDSCHTLRGVSGALLDGRNPHPPGWVGTNTQSRGFHGREARRDILSCAGCHEQGPATNCIRCHRVGGYGGNPHPPGGWPNQDPRGQTMCRYCHE